MENQSQHDRVGKKKGGEKKSSGLVSAITMWMYCNFQPCLPVIKA